MSTYCVAYMILGAGGKVVSRTDNQKEKNKICKNCGENNTGQCDHER